jgi:hypothetical protein
MIINRMLTGLLDDKYFVLVFVLNLVVGSNAWGQSVMQMIT